MADSYNGDMVSGLWSYWNSITDARAMEVDQERLTRGEETLSAETHWEDYTKDSLASFAHDHPDKFMRLARTLSPLDFDVLMSFMLVKPSQKTLGTIFSVSQTVISRWTIIIEGWLCAHIAGLNREERMAEVLVRNNLEVYSHLKASLKVPLSRCVWLYAQYRDYDKVAKEVHERREDVRRAIRHLAHALRDTINDSEANILGQYIELLTAKAATSGTGSSKRGRKRYDDLQRTDPDIMGQFRIRLPDPDWNNVLSSKSCKGETGEDAGSLVPNTHS